MINRSNCTKWLIPIPDCHKELGISLAIPGRVEPEIPVAEGGAEVESEFEPLPSDDAEEIEDEIEN